MKEIHLARIITEISRLQEEAEKLETEANSREREFEDTWRQYGSELAGPPASIEVNRNTAKELKRKADFLELIKNGDIKLERHELLKQNITLIERQIETLMDAKTTMYLEMAMLIYAKDVIK